MEALTLVALWAVGSVLAGFAAGWVIGRYGHGRCEPRVALTERERKVLAAELARVNRMEIRR